MGLFSIAQGTCGPKRICHWITVTVVATTVCQIHLDLYDSLIQKIVDDGPLPTGQASKTWAVTSHGDCPCEL